MSGEMLTGQDAPVVDNEATPVELQDTKPQENAPEGTATEGEAEKEQGKPQDRVFTQAELDAAVQKRLIREQRRWMKQMQEAKPPLQEPSRDSFRDDEAFSTAQLEYLAEKKAEQKLADREKAQQAERMQEAFLEKAEKATERFPDFQTVVSNPALHINDAMAEYIAESDLGADVAYHLGKNPLKAAAIAQMTPVKAARELSRIESEIASKPKATPSKAPEPINPVGSRGTPRSSSLPSDEDDVSTWMQKEWERTHRKR
jgi:hypothetical protein